MSSIQGVQGSSASALAAAAELSRQPAPKAQAADSDNGAQESRESLATVKADARKGDQEDIQRLAQSQVSGTSMSGGINLLA